jgi:hypothetical protein
MEHFSSSLENLKHKEPNNEVRSWQKRTLGQAYREYMEKGENYKTAKIPFTITTN